MMKLIRKNILLEQKDNYSQEDNYERFNLKNNLDILLYLITSYTPIDIITLNYYSEKDDNFKLIGYFVIIEDEFSKFILYNINEEINNIKNIIKKVYEYIEKNSNNLHNINVILNDEEFKEIRDKIYFMYFNNITFSKFYEIIETENTNFIESIEEIDKRLSIIDENNYEPPEINLSFYEIEKYIRKGPSPRIKVEVVPIEKEIVDKKTGKTFKRVYYVSIDKIKKDIKKGKMTLKDIGTTNERTILRKLLYVDLTQLFGDRIREYINKPEEFGIDAFSFLGKSQYYKGKLLDTMKNLGFNFDTGISLKFLGINRKNDDEVEISTQTSLFIDKYKITNSINKITIKDLKEKGFEITMETDAMALKSNKKLEELLKLIKKEKDTSGLTDEEKNRIKEILSEKHGENTKVKFILNKFNQTLIDKDGNKIERPIKQATIVSHYSNSLYEYYSMSELANLIDMLRYNVDKIDIDINNKIINKNNYHELYTKAVLIGFSPYNDNKKNFSLFKELALNNIQNHKDKDIKSLYPKVKELLDKIESQKNIRNPLKEFLVSFYKEIKSSSSYRIFSDAIKNVYFKNFTQNVGDYKLSFTTAGMTKDGRRSRSELVLDTYLILTDVDNIRYDGYVKKEHTFRRYGIFIRDEKTGEFIKSDKLKNKIL